MTKVELEIETDLDHRLNLKAEHVLISGGRLIVQEAKKEINSCSLSQIERAFVESGFGINKLIIKKKSGEEVEFCYFTKAKAANFGKLSEAINTYFSKGQTIELAFAKEHSMQVPKVHTLIWLYGFGRRYRFTLLAGLAISIMVALVNLVPPYLLKILIDSVLLVPNHSPSLFLRLIMTLLAAAITATILSMVQGYMLNKTGNKIVTDLRNKLFEHVVRMPPSFIDKMSTGRIISRLISDAGNTQWLMTFGLPTVTVNVLTLLGIGIILFAMYPPLAIYVLLPVPFVLWLVIRYRKRANVMYYRNWRRSADMTSVISDIVPNYPIVKAASKEKYESGKFDDVTDRYFDSQVDLTKLNIWHWPIVGFVTGLATLVIWWVGGHMVILGTIQLGIITAFIAYLAMFYGPINQLGNIIPFVQQSITSGQRLREILDEKIPALNRKAKYTDKPKGDIEFSDVSFEYMHPFPTIKNVNFKVMEGTKTVIVGKSGSGKTTLVRLLLRMYEPNGGKITIGGKDITEYGLDSLRYSIAYVPQEAVLFDNSVAYNVAYYSPGSQDPLKIMLACAEAAIHNEIMLMPIRYDTNIGERGYAMSGGQRQRLSIARGMLTDPNTVVLDEVTSNLDAINASEVEETIKQFTKHRTSISITHDANEIMGADYVIVMENGAVVEQGSPATLLKKGGRLSKLLGTKAHRRFLENAGKGRFRASDAIAKHITSATQIKIAKGSRPSLVNITFGKKQFKDLIPALPFPISYPEIVVFNDRQRNPIILLNDIHNLPKMENDILEAALSVTNFKFRIVSIDRVRVTGDGVEWFVSTDHGKRKVVTESRRSVIDMDMGKKLILVDKEGSIFEADRLKIDAKSEHIIESTL
ncbi:MAG: ABC transporter ATP-binding protein/permease [Candidatus Marsarchaeota archaeon]|nr:ABC transporter ATP-binding protein/permease [Candidatus Marsarchaeota archaeon]